MGKIYNAEGKRMGIAEICAEIKQTVTDQQRASISNMVWFNSKSEGMTPQALVAHTVLDAYHLIESYTEQGMRLRKLMDNLMTKYQKSATNASEEDMRYYKDLIKFFTLPDENQE